MVYLHETAVFISSLLTLGACAGKEPISSTQGQCNIQVTIIHLSQVFPVNCLMTIPEEMINSWVGCTPTVQAGIQTQAYKFVVRDADHSKVNSSMAQPFLKQHTAFNKDAFSVTSHH